MLSDEEKEIFNNLKEYMQSNINKGYHKFIYNDLDWDFKCIDCINAIDKVLKQSKEIEELKASHITTNNKATNTEKAKIFDVIENSIDTYIEKSKPYWEQIMTKDEMTIEEALTIIDDMYQDRYKIMSQKTEKETIVDLSKMDYIRFTNLEWASVRVLREVQSLNHKFKKLEDKIKAKIEEYDDKEMTVNLVNRSAGKTFQQAVRNEVRKVLQSLLEERN